MGSIKEISLAKSVTLLYTNSSKAELFVYDAIKNICSATRESIYDIDTKKDFTNMLEIVNLQPFLATKWFFVVNYNKLKSSCKNYKGVFQAETSCFLIKVSNYREYKEVKEIVPYCNDIYLTYIKSQDIFYIFKDFKISQKVLSFVQSAYASDVEKVFDLREQMLQGQEVETQKDVVKLIGTSGGTVSKLALQLLSEPPKTKKGFSMVCKRRLQTIVDLCDTYDVSTVRNFLVGSVKDILDIKILYLEGVIFKRIRDLPEGYDEKRLSKYQYCVETITNTTPYERVLRLYTLLKTGGVWKGKIDILSFLYEYYSNVEV